MERENKLDLEYELTLPKIKKEFLAWMRLKEKIWLEYYCVDLVEFFIIDQEGLNSVSEDYDKLSSLLQDDKYEYLKSIGIQ